jgi:DNA-binding CsgD family transcriptional regulator
MREMPMASCYLVPALAVAITLAGGANVVDVERVRVLHAKGFNDPRIARELGCGNCSIWWVRHKLGLPSNRRAPLDQVRLRELWKQGMTDAQIAEAMGAHVNIVRHARYRLRLPVHRAHPRQCEQRDCKFTDACGKPMESALTPEQCVVMREFLHDLVRCAMQRRPGWSINVGKFMTEWTTRLNKYPLSL